MEINDLADDGRLPKIALEASGFVHQAPIGSMGMGGKLLHGRQVLIVGCRLVGLQQRRLQRRSDQGLEVTPAHLRVGIFGGDHLALLGDADRALYGSARLGADSLITWTAATADRPTAPVEQAQPDRAALEDPDQSDFRLVELPT